ncbi:MAG: hypothetical protein WC401_09635 [Bacteroidales bacterium]
MKLTPEQKAANLQERRKLREATKEFNEYIREATQKPVKRIKITIDWVRSYTWGNNPHLEAEVYYHDGGYDSMTSKCSGCGYDKESTVIADVFNHFLKYKLWTKPYAELRNGDASNNYSSNGGRIEDIAKNPIPYGITSGRYETRLGNIIEHRGFSGGIGTSCYYAISQFIGGTFKNIASGKRYDVFEYEDVPCDKLPREADPFGSLKMVVALGSLMAGNDQEKVDFQKRMIGTVPGIDFPEEFDSLPIEEKKRRLDVAIEVLK